jgi:hypothetical protein
VLDQLPNTKGPDPTAARLLTGWTGDLAESKVGAVGAPDQGTTPTTASTLAPVLGIQGVTRVRCGDRVPSGPQGARGQQRRGLRRAEPGTDRAQQQAQARVGE